MGLNDFIKVGSRIKNIRKSKGLSQKYIAEEVLKIPRSTYSNYENDNRVPDKETLEKIAKALNVSVPDLLGITSEDILNEVKNMMDNTEFKKLDISAMTTDEVIKTARNLFFTLGIVGLHPQEPPDNILNQVIFSDEFKSYTRFLIDKESSD